MLEYGSGGWNFGIAKRLQSTLQKTDIQRCMAGHLEFDNKKNEKKERHPKMPFLEWFI